MDSENTSIPDFWIGNRYLSAALLFYATLLYIAFAWNSNRKRHSSAVVFSEIGKRSNGNAILVSETAHNVTTTKPRILNENGGPVCPYSAETEFIVEIAQNAKPTPLDLFEDWMDPESVNFGKPLAARWLNAGLSGQDTPGILRAGLKRLPDSRHFLVEEPFRIQSELILKAAALDDPIRRKQVFVFEEDSIHAQREVLELFLSFLPRRYPAFYKYDHDMNSLYVAPLDRTFAIEDWIDTRPLELCERIVQEDLILMRPPRPETDGFDQYALAAAAVVFSFSKLPEKLGRPMEFLHRPVPGYEKHLRKSIDLFFTKLLKYEQPMWRNNWGINPSGVLGEIRSYSDGFDKDSNQHRPPTRDEIKAKFLDVEYETFRRLPRSQYVLFTVKSMRDPLASLEDVPKAAQCLASSIRGMSKDMRKYKGIPNDVVCTEILAYLDEITSNAKNGNPVVR